MKDNNTTSLKQIEEDVEIKNVGPKKSVLDVLKDIKKSVKDFKLIGEDTEKRVETIHKNRVAEKKLDATKNKKEIEDLKKDISLEYGDMTETIRIIEESVAEMDGLFDVTLNVTNSDYGKSVHAVQLPRGKLTYGLEDTPMGRSVKPRGAYITDEGDSEKLNILDLSRLWFFYNQFEFTSLPFDADVIERFNEAMKVCEKTNEITYQNFYPFCRMYAVIKGFIGLSPNNETTISPYFLDEMDDDYFRFYEFLNSKAFIQLKEFTMTCFVLKAMSWFTTGHNLGVKTFSNIWVKTLTVYSSGLWTQDNFEALYASLYDCIHFASCKNILFAFDRRLAGGSYEHVDGLMAPSFIESDSFFNIRKKATPAGAAGLALADVVLDRVFATNLGNLITDAHLLPQLFKEIADMRKSPAEFHIGSNYLCGKAPRIENSKFSNIMRDLCSFVKVFEVGTSISKSMYLAKISKQTNLESTTFYKAADQIKKSFVVNANMKNIIISSVTMGTEVLSRAAPIVDAEDVAGKGMYAKYMKVAKQYVMSVNKNYLAELDNLRYGTDSKIDDNTAEHAMEITAILDKLDAHVIEFAKNNKK